MSTVIALDAYRHLLRDADLRDVFKLAAAGDDLARRAADARLNAIEAAVVAGELDDYEDEQ